MKKIAYIIPGYGESPITQRSYKKIAKLFTAQGIEPILVTIDWHAENPADFQKYIEEFLSQYKKAKGSTIYVLGFSFGAMIAYLSATKTKPAELILCSLSPYFEEDIPNLKATWSNWFNNNFTNNQFRFSKYAAKITAHTQIVFGDLEGEEILRRAIAANEQLENSQITIIKGAKHNINQKEYLEALADVIKGL